MSEDEDDLLVWPEHKTVRLGVVVSDRERELDAKAWKLISEISKYERPDWDYEHAASYLFDLVAESKHLIREKEGKR